MSLHFYAYPKLRDTHGHGVVAARAAVCAAAAGRSWRAYRRDVSRPVIRLALKTPRQQKLVAAAKIHDSGDLT